jgi:hypothetical protein
MEEFANDGIDQQQEPIRFNIIAKDDAAGRMAKVPVEIFLIGVDEFPPIFIKNAFTFKANFLVFSIFFIIYLFQLPSAPIIGQPFGHILAEDKDIGIGRNVHYLLDPNDLLAPQFVSIHAHSGALALKRIPSPKISQNGTAEPSIIRFTVWAQSGGGGGGQQPKRATATVYIEVRGQSVVLIHFNSPIL